MNVLSFCLSGKTSEGRRVSDHVEIQARKGEAEMVLGKRT